MNRPHTHRKMYRMTAKFKDIFKSPFSSFKILPVKVSLPMRFDSAMSFTLVWIVLFRPLLWYWLSHLKTLYLPYWFALRNTQPHTVGPFFNPLMQNKVCMWKFLLVMPLSDTPISSTMHGPFLGQLPQIISSKGSIKNFWKKNKQKKGTCATVGMPKHNYLHAVHLK